jgi:hypothetical protein
MVLGGLREVTGFGQWRENNLVKEGEVFAGSFSYQASMVMH